MHPHPDLQRIQPHPRFAEAVAKLDAGDVQGLRALLTAEPALVHARGYLEPPYNYFTAATLLHHVAGNPFRMPLPKNIAAISALLLEFGSDVEATTLGPNGGTTMGLLVTSKQASDSGASGPLIDVLLAHGAKLDLQSSDALDPSLANHAPRAAEKMIELGAKADLFAAAALGRMELLRDCFGADGHLKTLPVRRYVALNERDAIGLALLYAYVNRRAEVVDFLLEKDGNWNMTGVNNGTALHRATSGGDLDMIQRLVAKGADLSNRDNPYYATPYSWADHCKQPEVVAWMRAHCALDLADAICFDLPEQVAARIAENPRNVHVRVSQWKIAPSTPLHLVALMNRANFATLLLAHGAEVNALSGDGFTPLDIAEQRNAAAVSEILKQAGGKRAAEL